MANEPGHWAASVPGLSGLAITVGLDETHDACYIEVPTRAPDGRVTFYRASLTRSRLRALMSTLAEWPL